MDVMSGRLNGLAYALKTLNHSGILAWHMTNPCGSDDIGIYYLIPLLAYFLKIGSVEATSVFWTLIASLALLVSFIYIFALYKNWLFRLLSLIILYLFAESIYKFGDVYIAAPALIIAMVPLILYLLQSNKKVWLKSLVIFLCGFFIGIFHSIRSYSDIPVLIFILILLIFHKKILPKLKISFLGLLAIGVLIPILCFKGLVQRDVNYFHDPVIKYLDQHNFWHPIYLGLGYLPDNPYGIKWDDAYAIAKVHSIQPGIEQSSPLYETILRIQVLQIVKENPMFVIHTILAKAYGQFTDIRSYFITAFIFSLLFPKGWRIEIAFWALILLSALPGLLVSPFLQYILGFFAAVTMYMLISIGYALNSISYAILKPERQQNPTESFLANKLGGFLLRSEKIRQLKSKIIATKSPALSLLLASILIASTIAFFIINTIKSPYF